MTPVARRDPGFLRRLWAMIVKEFIQMRRDRLTFAMIIGIPIMQLMLFGYAINTDPEASADRGARADRRTVHAQPSSPRLNNTDYFDIVAQAHDDAEERDRLLARRATCSSSSRSRPTSRATLRARRAPRLLVEADATDPGRDRQRACGRAKPLIDGALTRRSARVRWRRVHGDAGALRGRACTAATTPKASPSTTSCPA